MKRINIYWLVIVLTLSLALPTTFAQRPAARASAHTSAAIIKARGVETISAAQLRSYLSFIASDEMEGRDTPSRGLDTTAKFIAMNLGRWGFRPMGVEGTFFQKIAMRREVHNVNNYSAQHYGKEFVYDENLLPNTVAGSAS